MEPPAVGPQHQVELSHLELELELGDDDCPIEEVRLTVPTTDDTALPALTFRTWFLGLLAFCNQFFGYRQNPLYISSLSVLPLGKLMAACLPSGPFINPGPFNLKEHVLITILVNMPVLLGATGMMPPARSVNYPMWGAVGLAFNHVVYRRYKAWWARHSYVLSAGLDAAGVAFMGILSYAVLQSRGVDGVHWWGLQVDDHCPLAGCPTAPGVHAPGCPVH